MKETDKLWVIQGGGLAAWAAAALLARSLPAGHAIRIEEAASPAMGQEPEAVVAEPDGPLVQLADGGATDLLAHGEGGFFLGVLLRNWRIGRDVAVVEQEPLPGVEGVAITDVVLRAARQSSASPDYAALLAPLQFQARVMAAGRYAHPSPDRQSPRSLLRPRLMLNARALTARLRKAALRAGVQEGGETHAAPFITVDTRPANRFDGADDWATRLGHDRNLTVRYGGGDHPPYVEMAALPEGLATRSALPGGGFASLAYAADSASSEGAKAALMRWLGPVEILEWAEAELTPGFTTRPWIGRRLAFGPAASRFGDALALDSAAMDPQLKYLAAALPGAPGQIQACADAYNQAVARDLGHRADRLHLILLQGPNGQGLAQPGENLARRIDQFASRNAAVSLDGDPYDAQHWTVLLATLGLTPRRYDVQADRLDLRAAMASLGRMVMAFDQTLEALPPHARFVERLRSGG